MPGDIPAIRTILAAHGNDGPVRTGDIVGPYVAHLIARHRTLVSEVSGEVVGFGAVVDTGVSAGDAVEITVLDRGEGVPAESREQIFNPFFTTKPSGVGLGLAISARIVGEHGGTIRVDSEPGRGASFTVNLPVATASQPGADS